MNEIKKDTEINAQESSENIASLDSKQKNCTSISGRIPTGSEVLDKLLKGGFEKETISTIYGPSGCGKTNFCLISAVEMVKDVSETLGGKGGGGRPDMAQSGGSSPEKSDKAIEMLKEYIRK